MVMSVRTAAATGVVVAVVVVVSLAIPSAVRACLTYDSPRDWSFSSSLDMAAVTTVVGRGESKDLDEPLDRLTVKVDSVLAGKPSADLLVIRAADNCAVPKADIGDVIVIAQGRPGPTDSNVGSRRGTKHIDSTTAAMWLIRRDGSGISGPMLDARALTSESDLLSRLRALSDTSIAGPTLPNLRLVARTVGMAFLAWALVLAGLRLMLRT